MINQEREILASHMRAIGRKGGLKTKKKYTKKQFQEWGRRGGRPKKVVVDKSI
jgi:general stress protein YciG